MKEHFSGPVYRIETPHLVIRCWNPTDAPLLHKAIQDNLEHLSVWMPWIKEEPISLTARIELMRRFRSDFDQSQDFVYGIFSRDETEVLGGTGLHPRVGPQAIEIGYWIHHAYTNRGLATEAASALTQVAFVVHQYKRVEIHCAPENNHSAAIPRKLGFQHEATMRDRIMDAGGGLRDTMIWTMLPKEYYNSPITDLCIHMYDAGGRKWYTS